jgi:phosphopantothenoylcysteine decarboxylase/phosphopantothenate--cysteine ligase
VIKAAAVSISSQNKNSARRKKTGKPEVVSLEPTDDILAELGRKKSHQILVGFCMERKILGERKNKLQRKNLDFIVANEIRKIKVLFNQMKMKCWFSISWVIATC